MNEDYLMNHYLAILNNKNNDMLTQLYRVSRLLKLFKPSKNHLMFIYRNIYERKNGNWYYQLYPLKLFYDIDYENIFVNLGRNHLLYLLLMNQMCIRKN